MPAQALLDPVIKRRHWLAMAVILLLTAGLLRRQGRRWWCQCGRLFLWTSDVWSSHNSQHLADPYTVTHIEHGFLFYWALAWLEPRLASGWRLVIATAVEAAWELGENTDFVINRYRETTISLDYFGDSVFNSLGDIAACVFGYWLARRLGWKAALACLIAMELILLVWIRDNLLLNIVMLIHPVDAIKAWQTPK